MKKIRLIELFAGIGSQAMALRDLGYDFEHYRVVEFDKYAIASYNAIHGTDFTTTDIRDVHASDIGIEDTNNFTYMMTYSFPCQDLSLVGKQAGMTKGGGTRSGLLWEVERILKECDKLPQVLIMENVTQVHSKKNIGDFNSWLSFLESKGYTNTWIDINATDCNVAQNRKRCFMVSVLEGYNFTKPTPVALTNKMSDYLEDEVDSKYSLKKLQAFFIDNSYAMERKGNGFRFEPHIKANAKIARAITTRAGSRMDDNFIVDINSNESKLIFDSKHKDNCWKLGNHPIRKLTPRECWRLMGFSDEDFEKAEKVNSNTQLYKQAGNSIVLDCLKAIIGNIKEL